MPNNFYFKQTDEFHNKNWYYCYHSCNDRIATRRIFYENIRQCENCKDPIPEDIITQYILLNGDHNV